MEYDYAKIGERIRVLRKDKDLSQDALIDELAKKNIKIGRNTLSAIENGNAQKCELSLLKALSEIFRCDIGHILCEYEGPTPELGYIQKYTGLSLNSVETLHELTTKEESIQNVTYKVINSLLDWILLEQLAIYCEDYNKNKYLDNTLYIQDKQGNSIGMLYGGDTAFLLAQHKFKDFLEFMGGLSKNHTFCSRSAWRKEIGKSSVDDIVEMLMDPSDKK